MGISFHLFASKRDLSHVGIKSGDEEGKGHTHSF